MRYVILIALFCFAKTTQAQLPETNISGVYEVMMGTTTPQYDIRYFAEFGFRIVDSATLTADQAYIIYGVRSALKTYRLQNGDIDSHGLLRLLVWDKPLGNGVGYTAAESIGRRISVMHCRDIIRLADIFKQEKTNGKKLLITEPTFDVIYKSSKTDNPDFFNRTSGVRENGVYGEYFAHVFFQRYGYDIPGYGTINPKAPLSTSEFTHHSFIVKGDSNAIKYYSRALGLKQENPVSLDGDWQKGPKAVFNMPDAYSHFYVGFVSPNNICGKLKFFFPQQPVPDKSEHQRIGELGMTLHSFYTNKLEMVYVLVQKEGIKPTVIQKNEFGERSFVFTGPDGVNWQIIEKMETTNKPKTVFEMTRIGN
jgi:uncharacterized glyoxalase superfamily protein PhnB